MAEPAPAPEGPAEVAGVVDRVVYRSPETGYTVLLLRATKAGPAAVAGPTLVGPLPPLSPGEAIRAKGVWRDDPAWGRQLQVDTVEVLGEPGPEAMVAFLASGVVPGVGEALAARIVEAFGDRLPEVLASAPGRLSEVPGLGPKLRARVVEAWQAHRRERNLLLFLHGHGLGAGRAKAILDAYGEGAVARLAADPYALARDVRGFGFFTADAFARRLGVGEGALARRVAALEHALREAAEGGDCAVPRGRLLARGGELLGGAPAAEVEEALGAALAAGHVEATSPPDGGGSAPSSPPLVQVAALARAEREVAARLRALAAGPPPWAGIDPGRALPAAERALGLELAGEQAAAVAAALGAKVLVVTGGPGTGKTVLVRALVAALGAPGSRLALCAPTGRAARRLAESTGREARTVHRLLEADPSRGFRRGAARPLEVDLVVCDEASMVDVLLMEALLGAIPEGAGLVLVGDVDQLPSVGPGRVLADVIESGAVPVVRLTRIFRQDAAGAIVTNAHAINRGRAPAFDRRGDEGGAGSGGEFFGVRAGTPEEAVRKVVELAAERIPGRFGLDPLGDVQVLAPTNGGPIGTRALNAALAARLNPNPPAALLRGDRRLAVGDKVMQVENDHEREVYNGDIGRVVAVDERARSLVALMDGREVLYVQDELDRLLPAFAVTVHKAQGSEYPAVVLALMRQHGRMLRRRLFYTAVTRAKRLVVVVGEPDAIDRAVRDLGERPRMTLLANRLRTADLEG